MFDYYEHLQSMTEEKIVAEIQKLNNQLFKMDPNNPMFEQIMNMLDMANHTYNDIVVTSRFKDAKDEAMDIGYMESEESTPDYSKQELLDAVVTAYRSEKPKSR